ncbi:MAG: PEP-CTERM sorting domain-containing protein [Akkermansia sp.]|nr:PEP-CTERM sorting domain-containing protein [Akkermansia sp.]
MKKTLIALAILASQAMADTPVWDLSSSVTEGDFLYNATTGLFTDNTAIDGTVLNDKNGVNQIQTNICFTLNLTQAQKVSTNTNIIKMDMAGDIGLTITDSGLSTIWGDSTNNRSNVSFETLLADGGLFTTANGDKCITLTFVQTYASGVQVWSNTTKHIVDGSLKGSTNTSLSSIYINSNYIEAVQFAPGWEGDNIVNTNKAFDALAQTKLVPEPTTATLSLLALASLAARRRRK